MCKILNIEFDSMLLWIRVTTNYDALYYWMLQCGNVVKIMEPLDLRERVKKMIEENS